MGLYGSIEEELDGDEDERGVWSPTGHHCSAACGDPISFADEVFVLTIVVATLTDSGLIYSPAVTADQRDYLYEPCFFCLECWESILEMLEELKTDEPPIAYEHAVLPCGVCASGIGAGEVLGLATFGEVHISKRAPNGENDTSTFALMDNNPRALCIGCLDVLNRDIINGLWNGRVTQNNECDEGTHTRCWRFGCPAEGTCGNAQRREAG